MRKFYLHKADKSKMFDLNTLSALATEPTGLGNNFSTEYKDSNKGKHLVNVKPDFDSIKFLVYFNADNSSGYANYKSLLAFLTECGTSIFLCEYNDGVTDKFCDVVLKSIPKSEPDSEGVFAEEIILERQSYWYEEYTESFSLKKTQRDNTFPLSFPFGFNGVVFTKEYIIKNTFFEDAPISIAISGEITNNIYIYLKSAKTNKIIHELQLSRGNVNDTIIINPTTKKITIVDPEGNESNGYSLTDKTKQSFLYLPQGEYIIGSNMDNEDTGKIEFSIKKYLFD